MKQGKLVDELTNKALKDVYFLRLFKKAELIAARTFFKLDSRNDILAEKEVLDLLRFADILSHSTAPLARNLSYKIISLLAEQNHQCPSFDIFAKAVLAKMGNFPGLRYLAEQSAVERPLPFERELEKILKEEVQKVPFEQMTFTDAQYTIYEKLKNNNHFSFSGPTSLGKSFIIESFVRYLMSREGARGNVIILVPTRALINQVSLKLKKDLKGITNCKVLTHPVVPEYYKKGSNEYVFVFTPERLLLFLSNPSNPRVEYLFVDEAQKIISEKDTRSPLYYHSILQAERKSIKLFFSSPNVPNPEVFLQVFEKNTEEVFAIKDSPVSQNRYYLDLVDKKALFFSDLGGDKSIALNIHSDDLFYWLKELGSGQKNIIYCNTIEDSILYAKDFSIDLPLKSSQRLDELIGMVKEVLHEEYFLIDCLKKGVGFHFGKLPQRIRIKLEELFRDKIIDWIFCTSTLLEGVNLPAKNIFILSNAIGISKFKDIDFWNLAGRAGRLTKDLSGNIICLRAVAKGGRWDNPSKDLNVVRHKEIKSLEPLVIKGQKNFFKNLENALLHKEFTRKQVSEAERVIWNSYANIAVIHEIRKDESVLRANFIGKNPEARTLLRKVVKRNVVPEKILTASSLIKIKYQNEVYMGLEETDALPKEVDYDVILSVLNRLFASYHWGVEEVGGTNPMIKKHMGILKYYATIMSEWVDSAPLSRMVYIAIKHCEERGEVWLNNHQKEIFDKSNRTHINSIINNLMGDIDNVLRFKFEKYFNNYYLLLKQKFGEKKAGTNWAEYLEYGTTDRKVIELQNIGFSRHLAKYILDHHMNCLEFDEDSLEDLNHKLLEVNFDKNSDEYKEYKEIF